MLQDFFIKGMPEIGQIQPETWSGAFVKGLLQICNNKVIKLDWDVKEGTKFSHSFQWVKTKE